MRLHRLLGLVLVLSGLAGSAHAAVVLPGPLVSIGWLAGELASADLVILDTRDASDFAASHIPGSLQTEYPGPWRTERDGVPWVLPDVADLEQLLGSLGVGADTAVVVVPGGTDATEIGRATWIYWVLAHLGHDAIAILDGGWAAWAAAGGVTEAGPARAPAPAVFRADVRPEFLATTEYVASRLATDTVLIDARPPAQFEGSAMSALVVRPGHIPGAVNVESASLYDPVANRFKHPRDLAGIVNGTLPLPHTEIIVYCNTGHWSSINWFVLHELLGYAEVRLYEGSIAAWSRNPALPMVTGERP